MDRDRFKEIDEESQKRLVESESENVNENLNPANRIGTTVGSHYEVLKLIGIGGMSAVYRARHILLDKDVALKVILPKLICDEKTVKRFKQEAKAATSLNHPNICDVSEFGLNENGYPYLVMELVEGKSLEKLIVEEGKLDPVRAVQIAIDVTRALGHAHSHGVIHRDMKPANILLASDSRALEEVKIVDFGIAKLVREDDSGPNLTKTGEIFGTPNYMSPEQCLGKAVDTKSDIYSLGCILYHMLTGKAPYESESTLQTLMSHLSEKTPEIDDASPFINSVIQKCMEKESADRYSSMEILREDLESYLAGDEKNISVPKKSKSNHKLWLAASLIPITFLVYLLQSFFINGYYIKYLPETNSKPIASTSSPIDQKLADVPESRMEEEDRLDWAPTNWRELHKEGDQAHKSGDTENALELYKKALANALQSGADKKDLAYLYEEIGGCATYLDKEDEAALAYYGAVASSQFIGDKDRLIKNMKALAKTKFSQKKFGEAIDYYERALKARGNIKGNNPALMDDWYCLGNAYYEAGQAKNAIRSLDNVFRIAKSNPGENKKALALSHWTIAKAYKDQGKSTEYKKHIDLSLKNGRLAGLSNSVLKEIKSGK